MRSRRILVGLALLSAFVSVATTVLVDDAEAQRGRRGRGRRRAAASAPEEAPQSAAIAPALGELTWGMSPETTFNHLKTQIEAGYREQITKAARTDAIAEDRIRGQMQEEIRRVRASFVRFRGQASGWDSSFLRDEYTHGNNEAMMVWRDESSHSQRFYFFINDRLWKLFQAFDASVYPGATFTVFADAIQGRFGQGVQRSGVLVEGRDPVQWIEWQDATTRLRAVDQTRFYGFFCLVFESEETLSQLASLRTHTVARASGEHALVDSVVRGESAQPGGQEGEDTHADIADRLTGQIRRRADAPEGSAAAAGSAGAGAGSSSSSATSSSGSSSSGSSSGSSGSSTRRDPDDPFAGMDL